MLLLGAAHDREYLLCFYKFTDAVNAHIYMKKAAPLDGILAGSNGGSNVLINNGGFSLCFFDTIQHETKTDRTSGRVRQRHILEFRGGIGHSSL